jgi:hypothetical protein
VDKRAARDQNPISLARGSDFTMVDALGKILGEETVRVAATIHTTDQARVWGKQLVFTCPGRKLEPGPVPRKKYSSEDSDPVSIRLSLLLINDIGLAGVSGEVMTMIREHLKRQSPLSHTVILTHANGSSGYIPDEEFWRSQNERPLGGTPGGRWFAEHREPSQIILPLCADV